MNSQRKITKPYPGIRSFEPYEHEIFFGREKQIQEVLESIKNNHFVAVLGSSGSGKSSLIKAGVIPTLSRNNPNFKFAIFRPGDNPIGSLSVGIVELELSPSSDLEIENTIEHRLRTENVQLIDFLVDYYHKHPCTEFLFCIDQFEELFRFRQNSEKASIESKKFINLILDASRQTEIPIYFILSLRSEFLGNCSQFDGLTEMINRGHYLIPKLTKDELKKAIKGPLDIFNIGISDDLINLILTETEKSSDDLPIMQHALMRTWQFWEKNKKSDDKIDLNHYNAIGTINNALSIHAEEIFFELKSENQKKNAEKIFKSLVNIKDEGKDDRRPTMISELIELTNAKEREIYEIAEIFRADGCSFISPPPDVMLNVDTMLDITRDSIIYKWKRLKEWVEEEAKSVQQYLRLSKSSELYQSGIGGLLINPELQLAINWFQTNNPNPKWAEKYDPYYDRAVNYLHYSKKEFQRNLEIKENKQKRDLKRARNSALVLGIASLVSLLFVLIALNLRYKAEASEKSAKEKEKMAVVESKIAEEKKREAVSHKKIAEQQQQIAEQQKQLTEQQKEIAIKNQNEAVRAMHRAVEAEQTATNYAKKVENLLKVNEKLLASEKEEKRKADSLKDIAIESEKQTNKLRRYAIAKSLAIQSIKIKQQAIQNYGTINSKDDFELSQILALQSIYFMEQCGGDIFDPDIFNALSEAVEDKITFRGEKVHQDAIRSIAMYSNTGFIACSDDDKVVFWDFAKVKDEKYRPEYLPTSRSQKSSFRTISVSSDEKIIAAGTYEGNILLWNGIQSKPLVINFSQSPVIQLTFNKQTHDLYVATNDKSLSVITFASQYSKVQTFRNYDTRIISFAFSPDNQNLALVCENGYTEVVTLTDFSKKIAFQAKSNSVTAVTFTTDNQLVIGTNTGFLEFWDISKINIKPFEQFAHISAIRHLEFNPTLNLLASCSYDGNTKLWNLTKLGSAPIILSEHDSWVLYVVFSKNNNYILSAGEDKTIRMSNINIHLLKKQLRSKLTKNMSLENWENFIGPGIEYDENLPNNN